MALVRFRYGYLGLVLCGFCLVHLSWILFRLTWLIEIDPNEGFNAWHAASAMRRQGLYPSQNDLIINNYPPLSFYLVGFFGQIIGDPIFAGRIVSLVATLAVGGLVALIVRQLGGGRGAATLGALFWYSSVFRFASDYVGANDPALLGLAVMLAGLTWYIARVAQGGAVLLPLVVMVGAGFIKHNLIVFPLLAFVWHAQHAGVAASLRAAVLGAGMAAAGLVACHVNFGPDFILQLTLPREFRVMRIVEHLNRLQFIVIALIVWGIWFYFRPRTPVTVFTAVWLGLGFLSYCLQKMSPGVAINALFEMWVGAAVCFGLAAAELPQILQRHGGHANHVRVAVSVATVVRLLADLNVDPYRFVVSADFRREIARRSAQMAAEAQLVRAAQIPMTCTVPTVCYRAGLPFLFDGYGTRTRLSTGHLARAKAESILAARPLMLRRSEAGITWTRGHRSRHEAGETVPLRLPVVSGK